MSFSKATWSQDVLHVRLKPILITRMEVAFIPHEEKDSFVENL